MKRPRRALALLLSLLLLLSALTGCDRGKVPAGPGEDTSDSGGSTEKDGPDAAAIAREGVKAAFADLRERVDASRLGDILTLLGSENVTVDYSFGLPDDGGEAAILVSGKLDMNKKAGSALIDATLSGTGGSADITLPVKLWYSPDFLGISSGLFDDGVFYGLKPENMAGQLEGTAFAELFSLDTEALRSADEFLAEIPADVGVYKADFLSGAQSTLLSLLEGRELTVTETALNGGDGYTVTAGLTAADTAKLIGDMVNLLPEGVLFYGIVSQDGSVVTLSDTLEKLRTGSSGAVMSLDVAGGKLSRLWLDFALEGKSCRLDAELYGEDGNSVGVIVENLFDLSLTLGPDIHFDMVTHSDMPTITNIDWKAGGELYLMSYTNDVTDLCLDGTAQAREDTLSFDGIWYSGERGDRNPLTFTASAGESAPTAPAQTRNVADMGASDLYKLAARLLFSGLGK